MREPLEAEVIEPAKREWVRPVVCTPKKGGKPGFCVDYCRLNLATLADAYRLPRIDDCIDGVGDVYVFTTLDDNCGYWQIPISTRDREITFFTTRSGTYRYNRMPLGVRNAPATFQCALDIILSGVLWKSCMFYLENVIVFSPSTAQNFNGVDEVLFLLKKAGITLKFKKSALLKRKEDYLGHNILPGKLAAASVPTKNVMEAPFPTDKTRMRSFSVACNVYKRFVPKFAGVARTLK